MVGGRGVERILGWVTLAVAVVMGASGGWLAWWWKPPVEGIHDPALDRVADIQLVHRVSSWVFVALVIALVLWRVLRAVDVPRAVALMAVTFAAVAGLFTGPRLAWQQLALWAITVDSDRLRGLRPFFFGDSEIRFVLIDNVEIATSTIRTQAIVHVALVPLVLVISVVISGRRTGNAPPAEAAPQRDG